MAEKRTTAGSAKPLTVEQASAQAERQRQEAMAHSVADGYREWEPALDDYGRARVAELREQRWKVPALLPEPRS
jgi:hypothetical protein